MCRMEFCATCEPSEHILAWVALERHDRPVFGDLAQQYTAEWKRRQAFLTGFRTNPDSVCNCPEYPSYARQEVWRHINRETVVSHWDQLLCLPGFPRLYDEKIPKPNRKRRRSRKRYARLVRDRRYLATRRYTDKSLANLARVEEIFFGEVRYGITKSVESVVELRTAA